MSNKLLGELVEFQKYVDDYVRQQSGKEKPSKQDYIKFIEQLQNDLLEQMSATHH